MTTPVLSVRDLTVEIPTRSAVLKPVDRVSYDIAAGEILGVVGESGAGKSMTGNAVIGLLDRPARIAGGEILLNGRRIDNLAPDALRRVRGKEIGMVFQDPLTSLNPLLPIGDQLTETMLAHLPLSEAEARKRAVADARRRAGLYADCLTAAEVRRMVQSEVARRLGRGDGTSYKRAVSLLQTRDPERAARLAAAMASLPQHRDVSVTRHAGTWSAAVAKVWKVLDEGTRTEERE